MKPYYDHNGITIYHGDCFEIIPELEPVDLVLTDPPYGIGNKMKGGTWGAKEKYADFRRWDQPLHQSFARSLCFLAKNVIIWGGNSYEFPPSRGWLIWDKQNAVNTMADCELAWTNQDKPMKRFSLPVGNHISGHPTEKPLKLFLWCLRQINDWSIVLDPFMGSGTTLVAAKELGRKAIGIEIEEKYCEIAVRRLAQEVLPFKESHSTP